MSPLFGFGLLFLLSIGVFVSSESTSSDDRQLISSVNRQSIDSADHIDTDELDQIRMRVEHMSDDELSGVLASVMPQQRSKRTIGQVRRCIEKVRCLFSSLVRLIIILFFELSKLTGIASNAANELLGKAFQGPTFSLSNLFKSHKSSVSSTAYSSTSSSDSSLSSSMADDLASSLSAGESEDEADEAAAAAASSSSDSSDDGDGAATILDSSADGSELVEEKACDQRCNISILMYRRLRRLLRNRDILSVPFRNG